jgi:hypothetical protein
MTPYPLGIPHCILETLIVKPLSFSSAETRTYSEARGTPKPRPEPSEELEKTGAKTLRSYTNGMPSFHRIECAVTALVLGIVVVEGST